ncbi:MAG: hypothetical protein WC433_08220 [Candidatus Omnitrophota bacterium]|jgi:hypothetical protein
MEGFEGLTSAFNMNTELIEVETDHKIKLIEAEMQIIEAKKQDLVNRVAVHQVPIMFQDQSYLQEELKSLILQTRTTLNKVEQDIKIGAEPRKIEVYAKLVESIGKQYTSLIELNKAIFEAQVATNQVDINNIGNNKIALTSDQLLDMINKASSNSQMKDIDAHFEIKE